MSELIALFGTLQMQVIVILVIIDVILGIVAGVVKKEFILSKLGNFMKGPVLAYILGFAVIEMVGQALPRLALIVPAVFALIVIALLASILKNSGRIGLPLPKVLSK